MMEGESTCRSWSWKISGRLKRLACVAGGRMRTKEVGPPRPEDRNVEQPRRQNCAARKADAEAALSQGTGAAADEGDNNDGDHEGNSAKDKKRPPLARPKPKKGSKESQVRAARPQDRFPEHPAQADDAVQEGAYDREEEGVALRVARVIGVPKRAEMTRRLKRPVRR